MSSPALPRQSTTELESQLAAKETEVARYQAAVLARQSTTELESRLAAKEAEVAGIQETLAGKRKSPEPVDDTEEKADEPPAKKQKVEVDPAADDSDFTDNEEEDEDMEDVIEEGTNVAVAYGNLDGLSKRKWYAAVVRGYDPDNKEYTVEWKYPPRSYAKKTTFKCLSSRLRVIEKDDYDKAPKRGTGYVGLHRASTFVVPEREPASDEDSEEEEEGLEVGDYVAVAYGAARGNKRGKDPSAADPSKYKKRFLWYAATIVEDLGDEFRVEWKFPMSKRDNAKFFTVSKDKVQPVTAKEFKRSRKIARGKTNYGLVGIHRLQTKAALTSG